MALEQRIIINELNVEMKGKGYSVENIIKQRAELAQQYADRNGIKTWVLGLSGGVDSYAAAAILSKTTPNLLLIALPNGNQADISDTYAAYDKIVALKGTTKLTEVNIEQGFEGVRASLNEAEVQESADGFKEEPYALGNISARLRMVVQYAMTQHNNSVVVGTDHATEAVVGYYTKYGDGGTDFNILAGLTKDMIYEISAFLGAPDTIISKAPAANLGISSSDEAELGMSYITEIAPFLQGHDIGKVNASAERKLMQMYAKTTHKRQMPASAQLGDWWNNGADVVGHIVVDEVNAFIDMELACENAKNAVGNTVDFINQNPSQLVFYIQEYHPADHCSFKENGGIWPVHGVQGTRSCELSAEFANVCKASNRPVEHYNVFRKGMDKGVEQYSGYNATNEEWGALGLQLPKKVYVSGIATEYCVNETIKDLLNAGHEVYVKVANLAYVDKKGHEDTIKEWIKLGVHVEY